MDITNGLKAMDNNSFEIHNLTVWDLKGYYNIIAISSWAFIFVSL